MSADPIDMIISALGLNLVGHGSWMFVTERVPRRWPGLGRDSCSPVGAAVLEMSMGAGMLVGGVAGVLSSTPLKAMSLVLAFFGMTLGALKERQATRRVVAEATQAPRASDDPIDNLVVSSQTRGAPAGIMSRAIHESCGPRGVLVKCIDASRDRHYS